MDIRKFTQQFFEIYNFNLAKYSPFSRFSFHFSVFSSLISVFSFQFSVFTFQFSAFSFQNVPTYTRHIPDTYPIHMNTP